MLSHGTDGSMGRKRCCLMRHGRFRIGGGSTMRLRALAPQAVETQGGAGTVTMMIVRLARAHRQAYWPRPLPPMLSSPAPPFHQPGWIYEEKYDGWRCLAYKRGGLVRLLSRHGIDYTGRFRALAAAIAVLPASTLLLDGEVTAFDEHLLSRRAFLHSDPWLTQPSTLRKRG